MRWLRRSLVALAALIVAGGAWAVFPRQPDLARFDPEAMARGEAAMWRDYYEKRYLALFWHLYAILRDEYGFSPWDAFRIAVDEARAAQVFQPTTSRAEAQQALPLLREAFSRLAKGAPGPIDPDAVASAELQWWEARRDAATPEEVGAMIARATILLYGVDRPEIREAGVLRAEAMAYRDAHAERMTDADWEAVAAKLALANGRLKAGLSAR